jgi:hypothetical protein
MCVYDLFLLLILLFISSFLVHSLSLFFFLCLSLHVLLPLFVFHFPPFFVFLYFLLSFKFILFFKHSIFQISITLVFLLLFENPYKGISIVCYNIQRKEQSSFDQKSGNTTFIIQHFLNLFVNLSRTCYIKPFTAAMNTKL